MREKKSGWRIETGTFSAALLSLALFIGSCTKNEIKEEPLNTGDLIAPTVISATPVNNSTDSPTNSVASVTFSEPINTGTITQSSFIIKQGTTDIPGTIASNGAVVTFTPSTAFIANTLYTGTITTAVKDVSGNSMASDFTWSFTTSAAADVTAPAVLSVSPALNATSVAVNFKPTVSFSEAMNSVTITSTSFNLKQGTSGVPGTVTYSGTTATFTPTTEMASGKVYTGTITTAVKDVAGNAMAANYSWSFTTVSATPTGKSFSADVVPILNLCNSCHTHKWTTSSNSSTFYNNLVNGGFVVPASPTTSKIYSKINNGHPSSTVTTTQKNTIVTWMTEGSKNN